MRKNRDVAILCSMPPKKIVILGSGFAGVYAYLELHKLLHADTDIDITVVSESDAFVFIPLLHEVATGSLMPQDITQPIHTLPACCLKRFTHGRAVAVNLDRKEITLEHSGLPPQQEENKAQNVISYDYLISTIGSETNFFGVPGAREYALPLKNLADAARIKNRIIEAFEERQHSSRPEQETDPFSFIIIGGGATGVELAGELADYLRHELARAFPALSGKVRILLIHGGKRLVENLNPWFDKKARAILAHKKIVTILYEKQVTEVMENGVRVQEEIFPASVIFWSAGVKARELPLNTAVPPAIEQRSNRILVNAFLQVPAHLNVFIAGDQAWIRDIESQQPYPMRAQFAAREGALAASNIYALIKNRPLKEFAWNDKGFIISLGKGGALAEIYGIRFSGPFAWWLYRTVYASKIIGWRTRIRTVLGWTLDLFFPRDISRL